MKRSAKLLGLLAIGAMAASALSEISPIFTIGFWRLAYAREFVMFAGTDNPYSQYPEAKQFLRVLGAADPEDSFLFLYRIGNMQGKAFALFGLHELGSPKLEGKLVEFAKLDGSVRQISTMCLRDDLRPAIVAEEIRGWKELVVTSIVRDAEQKAGQKKSKEPNQSSETTRGK